VLEATQPSLASRLAPAHARGAALGVYNTLQSLGFFAGGAVGGWVTKTQGAQGLFWLCGGLMLLWLLVAWPMKAPGRHAAETVSGSDGLRTGQPAGQPVKL
jgi:predicted MFS family arabinose efflux permease